VRSILVVEDSATMRSLIASTLEELDPSVKITEAGSGFEALRLLPRGGFDLIVTDINMPDINGLELVSFVKKNPAYAGIPLIIVSTESSQRDRDKGLGLGADAYLVKPFEPEDLRGLARELPLPCANRTSPAGPTGRIRSPGSRAPSAGISTATVRVASVPRRTLMSTRPRRRPAP